jgi:DNA-binding response OmpR family regulator
MTALKLLIIDDDRDFAEGLAEALELHGHQVGIAFTGEEGVEAVEKDDYDTILMDIGLPGLNGVESLLKIRLVNPKARCFLLTGHSAYHIAKQGIEAGAIEILTKPIDPKEILRRLSNTETRN